MAMLDESKEAVGAVNVVPTQSPVAGLSSNDPEAQARMREAMKMRGMDYARAGIMGAAAGGQAGAQTMNPLAAFVQGMAAGLQAPAQIYEQKRQQAQSVYDATPFGVTHSEVVKDERYRVLAGLPTGIAVKVIGAIAQDAAKVALETEAAQKLEGEKAKLDLWKKRAELAMAGANPDDLKKTMDVALTFNRLPEAEDFLAAQPVYNALIGAPNDAAGDKTLLVNFARLISPTFTGNEKTMTAVDVSGIFDKMTVGLWNRIANGEDMSPKERALIKREATRLYNIKEKTYTEGKNFWREEAAARGLNPAIIGKDFGKPKAMRTPDGEVVYVVDFGDGRLVEVGGE
jgi:hypothetical protein